MNGFAVLRTLTMLSLVAASSAAAQVAVKPVAVIGGEQDRGATLENPNDIALVGDRILVLDANEPFLKLFDLNGKLLQRFVKKGSGPGEISAARRFTYDSVTRRVYTWDVMNLRANVYALTDTLRFETSFGIPAPMEDGCFLGRRLFALGMFNRRMLHELEPRGADMRVVRSLAVARGNHPLDSNPMYQHQVSKGRLACDARNDRLVAVSSYGGVAHIVGPQTGVQETVNLDGLLPLYFQAQVMNGKAGVAQWAPNNTFDIVRRVEVSGNNIRFFADHLGKDHSGNEDFESVSEWFIQPAGVLRKGVTSRQREIGRTATSVVCFTGAPVPTLEVYRAARCP